MRLQTHQSGTDSAARPRASSAPGAEDRVNERLERARRCGQVEDLQGLCRALDPALTWNSAGSSRMTVSNARAAPPKSPRCTSSAPLAPIRNDERSSSEGGGEQLGVSSSRVLHGARREHLLEGIPAALCPEISAQVHSTSTKRHPAMRRPQRERIAGRVQPGTLGTTTSHVPQFHPDFTGDIFNSPR